VNALLPRRERVDPAGGVQELAKAHRSLATKRPYVDEGNVEVFAGSLRNAPVSADDDDLVPSVEELLRSR